MHASERQAPLFAAENPLDRACMVQVVAGNDALSTVKAQNTELTAHQFIVFRDDEKPERGFLDQATSSAQRAGAGIEKQSGSSGALFRPSPSNFREEWLRATIEEELVFSRRSGTALNHPEDNQSQNYEKP